MAATRILEYQKLPIFASICPFFMIFESKYMFLRSRKPYITILECYIQEFIPAPPPQKKKNKIKLIGKM